MSECVFSARVDGVTVPARSLRPLAGVWATWCAEQGIDDAWVESVDVTRDEDGKLTAHCNRRVRNSPSEMKELRVKAIEEGRSPQHISKVKVFPKDESGSITRTYVTDHPVNSIDMLLAEAFPHGVPEAKESV